MTISLAVAQVSSNRHNLQENIKKHVAYIKRASELNVDFILFPELSLTGYDRQYKAQELFIEEDDRLGVFEELSLHYGMTIVIGVPIKKDNKIYIGSMIALPNGTRSFYYKNYLHEGEDILFSPGENPYYVSIRDEKIALSICYDIENEAHISKAYQSGASIYAASIFYSVNGMDGLRDTIVNYQEKYPMDFIISNFKGHMWGGQSGGRSMFLEKQQKAESTIGMEGLILCRKDKEKWHTAIHGFQTK